VTDVPGVRPSSPPILNMTAIRSAALRTPTRTYQRLLAVAIPLGIALLGGATLLTGSLLPALMGAAALAGVGLLIWSEAAALIFFFGLYLNVPVVAIRNYGVPFVAAAGFIMILGIPILAHLIRRRPLFLPPIMPALLGYLGALIISSLLSVNLTGSIDFTAIFVSEGLVLVILVTNAVRTTAGLRRAIWAVLIAGAVMGGISVVQEVTRSYDSTFGGFASVNERGFAVEETIVVEDVRPRLTGPVGEQNRYAQVLVVLLPIAYFHARSVARGVLRLAAAACGLLILGGLLLTFSRMGLLTIGVMVVLLAVAKEIRWKHLFIGGAAAAVGALIFFPDVIIRLDSLGPVIETLTGGGNAADSAVLGRLTSNIGAWRTFTDFPLFGVGPSVYASDYSGEYMLGSGFRDYSASETRQAHNLYLHILADTGFVGFVAFMAALIGTIAMLMSVRRRTLRSRPDQAAMATGIIMALAAFMVTGIFLHMGFERYFWVLIALGNAAVLIMRGAHDETEKGPAPPQWQTPLPASRAPSGVVGMNSQS
jgi:putative inorganic carbon (hco3(-)) transporter